MLTLGRAPLVPGDGHNITQNTRWPVHAAQKAFLTFTHLSAFYAFAKKTKIFLRQTLAEHIPWELITLGDVRNSSSLNTLSALVGNSFWDYVITGIVLGDPCHWYNAGSDTGLTYLVISGSPGMLWLCPRHGHCLRCLHCQLSSVSPLLLLLTLSPHSPGCHLLAVFTFYHFFWPYFVAGVSFFCDRTSDLFSCWHRSSVSALSTQKFSWLAPVWAPVSLF